jgi:ectoine hydroxylase-related dioxygenase (phytanoyl-CoA dioxygenase family)
MVDAWVAFEDVDENNGPLRYYKGSHKLPVFDMSEMGLHGSDASAPYEFYGQYEDHVERLVGALDLKPEYAYLKKGDGSIWAANLLHGGSKIKDPSRTRYSQVTHYYF